VEYVCYTYYDGSMQKKLTITVDEAVYEGLHRVVGRGNISHFLNDLARPHVVSDDLEKAYREMAADEENERDASEWIEGLMSDVADELP
jgi:predicted CopG family antitoxin